MASPTVPFHTIDMAPDMERAMQDMAGVVQADPVAPSLSRRNMLKFAGAGVAATSLAASGAAWAQVPEEANTEPLTIVRKGIDEAFEAFNIDILEEQAKKVYGEGTYVFVDRKSTRLNYSN